MVRPAAKKHFLIEKSVASQDGQPINGRVEYCTVLRWSLLDDWASRYEDWNIGVAFGSMVGKGCKTSAFCLEIRESTNQKSSIGD